MNETTTMIDAETITRLKAETLKSEAHETSIRLVADCFFAPEPVLQRVITDGMAGWGSFRRGCARGALELIAENIADAVLSPAEADKFMTILHNLKPRKIIEAPVFED